MLGKTAIGTTSASGKVFPGQYYDQETGLHYNYFRYYDPSTGRYITADPIGLAGGRNSFVYADANPLRYIDPLGLQSTHKVEIWLYPDGSQIVIPAYPGFPKELIFPGGQIKPILPTKYIVFFHFEESECGGRRIVIDDSYSVPPMLNEDIVGNLEKGA